MKRILKIIIACTAALVACSADADTNAFLNAWIAEQAKLKTWRAEFVQTRTLKALNRPLETRGRLDFAAPNQFRWQLGEPAQTIAVRGSNEMTVIYPKLKRAERYPLTGGPNEPWRDALALMDAGFPTSRGELEERFRLTSLQITNGLALLSLEPRSAMARKFMAEARLTLRTNDYSMTANELRFSDGSILRNDFTNAARNPELPSDTFAVKLPQEFKVVEAAK